MLQHFMRPSLRISCCRFGSLHHARATSTAVPSTAKKYPSRIGGTFYQEGDRVIVTSKEYRKYKKRLTAPLRTEGITLTGGYGHKIKHDDIIGRPAGKLHVLTESASTKTVNTYARITHPTLEQFVSLAPREVTPIYSSYGATIIDLLDIHPAPPLPNNHPETSQIPRLEILEAGTGNGGLTLHLARAIAAANPPPPQVESTFDGQEAEEAAWEEWRKDRRALVHTVEFQASRSRAVEELIKSFRGALYWPHIDFHSGDVGRWARDERERRHLSQENSDGFLDIVVLDVPGVHEQIQHVVDAMKDTAQLVVWVPQVTQVAACQFEIDRLQLPLNLDQVVELGEGVSNGRQWDVRFVKTRAEQKKEQEARDSENTGGSSESDESVASASDSSESVSSTNETGAALDAGFPTMVCRPKVGEVTVGGGFVGIWRRKSRWRSSATSA